MKIRFVEFFLFWACVLWGVWLIIPWDTYNITGSLWILRIAGSEWFVGGISFSVGAAGLYGLRKDNLKVRRRMMGGTALFWFVVAVSTFTGEPRLPSVPIYLLLFGASVYVHALLKIEEDRWNS